MDANLEMDIIKSFVSSQLTSTMPWRLIFKCCSLVTLISVVSVVRMLLIMAGIETNPGPTDKFIFRYQFLLVQLGTEVLRKLFDHLVNNDFMAYLKAKPQLNSKLQFLMNRDIITAAQKQFLPPVDTKPKSANFDVTLLACLLRNVCGLRGQKDPVWNNPPSTDVSIEADIFRLRDCRNNLLHSGTVFIDETVLATKWNELCMILNRLNNTSKIADLPTQISNAEAMDVDEELKECHTNIIQLWREMDNTIDHGIGELSEKVDNLGKRQAEQFLELKEEIAKKQKVEHLENIQVDQLSEIKTEHAELKTEQTELKTGQAELKLEMVEIKKCLHARDQTDSCCCSREGNSTALKQHLIETYNRECGTLPAVPLHHTEQEEFFKVYKTPTMYQEDYGYYCSESTSTPSTSMSSYKDILIKDEERFQNIYVTGDAGVGKTSLCKCLCLLWCKSQTGGTINNQDFQSDIDFLAGFEFVFYISLRDTECRDVVSIIVDQFYDSDRENATIEHVLRHHKCLVIFDELDEWSPKKRGKRECKIPFRVHYDGCVYLTTCQPYKFTNVRLSRREIDQHVRISGIHGASLESFIRDVVDHMNKKNGVHKNVDDFMRDVKECDLGDQLCIPLIASHLIGVWFAQKLTGMSKTYLYGQIVEVLFVRSKQRNIHTPASPTAAAQFPDVLTTLKCVKDHVSLLPNVLTQSFRSMFQ